MQQKNILIILILIVLVISGCKGGGRGTTPINIEEYHKGTDGLVIDVIEDMPPKEIDKLENFKIGLELQNNGAFDIVGGLVKVHVRDRGQWAITDESGVSIADTIKTFDLEGKSRFNQEGKSTTMTFNLKNIDFPDGEEEIEDVFDVTAQYAYQTEASADVCVDPYFKESRYENVIKTCEMKDISLSGGQGAPVAVTKVETKKSLVSEDRIKMEYTIYIENKGKGEVDGNVVQLTANLPNSNLDCDSTNELKEKREDYKPAKCTMERSIGGIRGTYSSILSIRLNYIYKNTKDITVNAVDPEKRKGGGISFPNLGIFGSS